MSKIKIFISSDLYLGRTTGYLFGYVTEFKESLTFYLLRSCSIDTNFDGNGQLFGEICDVTECTDRSSGTNAFNFVQFVRGTNSILLNRIFVKRDTAAPIGTVQIILYDHIKWKEASASDLASVDAINEDCIKGLSLFINEEFNKVKSIDVSSSRWSEKHVQIMSAIMPVLNFINKLAVVKHMVDWYHCLNSGLLKK